MYKVNYGNSVRRKGNSDTYKYRYEAHEAPTEASPGQSPTSPTPFAATVFNNAIAVTSSDYIASNDSVNNELERIWKEVVMG
jgi:hypothetical protein